MGVKVCAFPGCGRAEGFHYHGGPVAALVDAAAVAALVREVPEPAGFAVFKAEVQ
jgi:acyl-coenzyme A thioesterase PaaI-like protein